MNGKEPAQYSNKRRRTRARLVTAAMTVLARHGLEGATIGAIAAEAGVVTGTVYHHFESREVLVEAVIDELASTMGAGLEQVRAADDDPAMRIALAAVGLVDRARGDSTFASAFGHLMRRIPELNQMVRIDIAAVVRQGIASGRFIVPDQGRSEVTDALIGVATGAALNAAAGDSTVESPVVIAYLMLAMLGLERREATRVAAEAGLAVDAPSARPHISTVNTNITTPGSVKVSG